MKPVFAPNISNIPKRQNIGSQPVEGAPSSQSVKKFEDILKGFELQSSSPEKLVKFSAHALQRLQQRGIQLESSLKSSLKEAFNQLETKGSREAVIFSDQAAFVVSVPKRKVITAMDPSDMKEKVFTNIDSAIFLNDYNAPAKTNSTK
jgi:flagellar operon protein